MRHAPIRIAWFIAGFGLFAILLFLVWSGGRSSSGPPGGVYYAGTTNGPGDETMVLFRLLNARERSVAFTPEYSETRDRADEGWARISADDASTILVPARSEGLFRVRAPANAVEWRVVFRHDELPPLPGRVLDAVERLLGGEGDRGTTVWLSSPEMMGSTPAPREGAPPKSKHGHPGGLEGGDHR